MPLPDVDPGPGLGGIGGPWHQVSRYVGVRISEDRIRQLLNSDQGPVAKLVMKVCAKGERYAKQRCPVDTGRLRASISHRLDHSGTGFAADGAQFVGIVGTNVEYAPYVEFGTERQAPAAFLRGGCEQAVTEEVR